MKLRILLAVLLSLLALAAFAQNVTPPSILPSIVAPPPPTTDERVQRLERQVTDLQNRVLQLEDATKLKIRPLTENR
jgi:hypothetical protein